MKPHSRISILFLLTLIVTCAGPGSLQAEDVLFIGNSYTAGGPNAEIRKHGGIPKLVEEIAASKGRKLSTMMLAPGGKDWAFDLKEPITETTIELKKWDWVVLQDFSTEPTHIGDLTRFFQDGETLYKQIRKSSPRTKVLLYETWARAKGHEYYTGVSTEKTFVDPAEMAAELHKNYTELHHRLEALEPGDQVGLALVGEAFARCTNKYPDIKLHWSDKHHSSIQGGYLTALVIYASLFHDSPKGAAHEIFGITLDPVEAEKLQQIADEVTSPNTAGSSISTTRK